MKLESIQILRGIAAMLVVVYHTRAIELQTILANGFAETPIVGGLWKNGYAGVDLFFVISGFIMVYVTGKATPGVKTSGAFLFARFTRIYPIWWVFAGFFTVYMIIAHGILNVEGLGWGAVTRTDESVLAYLIKSYALIPQGAHPILGVGWTLVHEMYFYIAFAGILFLPRRLWPAAFALWAGIIIAGSLIGLSAIIPNGYIQLITHPMTFEFILGATGGLLATTGRRYRPAIITLGATLWLMAALCLQGTETSFTLMWGRVLWFGLPAALLVYGFACLDMSRRLALLVPVGAAALVTALIFQLYSPATTAGTVSPLLATIVAVTVGAIAMGAILWIGFLMGYSTPSSIHAMRPALRIIKRAFVKLGDWSYALYLCHMIVLAGLARAFTMMAGFLETGGLNGFAGLFRLGTAGVWDNLLFALLAISGSICLAWLSYRYIEKPLIRYFAKLRSQLFGEANASLKPADITPSVWLPYSKADRMPEAIKPTSLHDPAGAAP